MTDTMTRETEGTCSCGCGDPSRTETDATATGGCSCGCGSTSEETPAMTVAREVAHLTSLRQSIDRRLAELKS